MPTIGQRLRNMIGSSFGADLVEASLEKAMSEAAERASAPVASFYHPMEIFTGREWVQRGNRPISYEDLRAMARNPIIGAIIQTRVSQIAAFCSPQQDAYDYGFKITSDDKTLEKDTEFMRNVQEWVYNCGIPGYGESNLETFARKFMRDSLTIDQACAEVVGRRNGAPAYMVAVDGASIRRLKESLNYATPPSSITPHYVQIIDEQIVAKYTYDQLIFGVRNPQTDLAYAGYGMSELEILVRTVTSILNTEKYNSGQITQGGTQKGVLVVKGDTPSDQFDSFKRDFREAIRNAASFWRPPVLRIGKDAEIEWVTLDRSNRDMEYAQLFDFLVKQACGVYQIDPSEINWQIGATGSTTTFESRGDLKIQASQNRGLKPLLTFLANQLNTHVITKIDPRLRLEFVGLDLDRSTDVSIVEREVKTYKTVNEARIERGLEPIQGGDIILSQDYSAQLDRMKPKEAASQEEEVDVEDDALIHKDDQRGTQSQKGKAPVRSPGGAGGPGERAL